MLKLGAGQADKETAAVRRRQAMEAERKQRIFNAKARTSGVDKEALDAQIALKKKMQEEEKARDRAFENQMLMYEQIALAQEEEVARLKREETAKLKEFWANDQRKENAREWDLNDPHGVRKAAPPRPDADDIPDLGPSSLQVFDGEDNSEYARKTVQRAQMQEWAMQQMAERQNAINREQEEERLYQLQAIELANRAMEMEAAAAKARRDQARATAEYNLALSNQRKDREAQEAVEEFQDNIEEIKNQLESDLLTENPDRAKSSTHKVVREYYKGMSPEELAAVRREQAAQIAEKEREKERERQEERQWEKYGNAVARLAAKQEMEVQKQKQAQQRQILALQKQQMVDKRNRDGKLAATYTNQPTDDFFKQFGTSSR